MKRFIKNIAYLFVSNILVRLLSAIGTILITRYLGPSDYGIISVALSITAIVAFATDLGLSQTFIREATRGERVNLSRLIGSHIVIRFILVVIIAILLVVYIEFSYGDLILKKVIYFMVFPTLVGAALQGVGVVYFQSTEQMKYTAFIRAFSGLITGATLLFAYFFEWPLVTVSLLYGVSSLLGGIYSIYLLVSHIPVVLQFKTDLLEGIVSFTIGGMLVIALPQLPPIILEKVTSLKEVGTFFAAYRLPVLMYQVPGVVAMAFYPALFRYGSANQEEQQMQTVILEQRVMTLLAGLMLIPIVLYADWWVNLIYGEKWNHLTPYLSMLTVVVLIQSIYIPLADLLTTSGSQNKRTLSLFICFLVAICSYYILGTIYHALGAVITVILIETLLLTLFLFFNRKRQIGTLLKGASRTVLAMVFTLIIGSFMNSFVWPALGIFLFPVLFLGLVILIEVELREFIKDKFKKMKIKVFTKG